MENLCDCCGEVKEIFIKSVEKRDGERIALHLCDECRSKIENAETYYVKTSKGYVKNGSMKADSGFRVKSGWTSIVKGLNVVLFIALVIIGGIIGGSMGDAMFYDDGAEAVGAFLGVILGGLSGTVIVSFSMLFVEISENLASVLDYMKKDE